MTTKTKGKAGSLTVVAVVAALAFMVVAVPTASAGSWLGVTLRFEDGITALEAPPWHFPNAPNVACVPNGHVDGRDRDTCSFTDVEIRIQFAYDSASYDAAGYRANCATCVPAFVTVDGSTSSIRAGGASGTYDIWVCDATPGSPSPTYAYCLAGSLFATSANF